MKPYSFSALLSRMKQEGLAARLVLQVHDELIVEAPQSEADRAAQILGDEMEHARADVDPWPLQGRS